MTGIERGRGRPRAISREMLQESAFDLFLSQGYAATTIEEITRAAGVSRTTFFNYFTGKSGVFWPELDDAIGTVRERLAAVGDGSTPVAAVRESLLSAADAFGPGRVPWALTQHAFIGASGELQASALASLTALTDEVRSFLTARSPDSESLTTPAAYAIVAAAVASARTWADAGTSRGPLRPYLDAAISPVCAAFDGALAR